MKTKPFIKPVSCPFCGYELFYRKGMTTHFKACHHQTTLQAERLICNLLYGESVVQQQLERYKNGEICVYDMTQSGSSEPDIVKLITLLGLKRSSSEEHQTPRYKKRQLQSIQQKYGSNITNVSQVKEVQQKKIETFAKTWGSYETYLENARSKMAIAYQEKNKNPEFQKRKQLAIEKAFEAKYGVGIKNASQIPGVSDRISSSQKKRYAKMTDQELRDITKRGREKHMEILNSLSSKEERKHYLGVDKKKLDGKNLGSTSLLEKRIHRMLETQNIVFEHNKFLFHKNWDILFPNQRIILEIQGDYFHANPKFYHENDILIFRGGNEKLVRDIWKRDADRKILVEQNGWTMKYLWEADINYCLTESSLLELLQKTIPEIFSSTTLTAKTKGVLNAVSQNNQDRTT